MGQFMELVLAPARRSRGYADRLLVGITPERAARKPRTDGGVIDTNHPAFVFGHLGLYPARMMRVIGLDPAPVTAPPEWEPLFKAGAPCQDDPACAIYPKFDMITRHFTSASDTTMNALASLDDSVLLRPTPDERLRVSFPTAGSALNFLLGAHVMMHLGQVSVWRRCFGLPAAM
jgi:hypothetical protein